MTDSQEKKANDSQDSRTININIPVGCFEGMLGMMTGNRDFGKAGPGCCEMNQGWCCPQSEKEDEQEIRIVIKKKEQ
jgi:hypothetical protein